MADPLASDVWIEDASIASIMIQLQAEDLGLGSCWVQVRERSLLPECLPMNLFMDPGYSSATSNSFRYCYRT